MKSTFTFALSFIFSLIVAVTAVPAGSRLRGIPRNLFVNFELVAQYAAAAYCPNNSNGGATKVTCPKGNCPLVESANTVTIAEFEKTLITDTSGFVAVDHTNRLIILSFRGTQSIKNAIVNLSFQPNPTDICNGCEVHEGFMNAWTEIRPRVLAAIALAVQRHPTYHIIVTGHSLGGALADLAVSVLRIAGHKAALYTFGAPRVGNDVFSRLVSSQLGGNFRITNSDDPVPNLPPPNLGYSHIAPEFWIASNGPRFGAADINVLMGADNPEGNAGTNGLNLGSHYNYFGEITACGTGFSF